MEKSLRKLLETKGWSRMQDRATLKGKYHILFYQLPEGITMGFHRLLRDMPEPVCGFTVNEITGPEKTTTQFIMISHLEFTKGEPWTFCWHEEETTSHDETETVFHSLYFLPHVHSVRKPRVFLAKLRQLMNDCSPLVLCKFQYQPKCDVPWKLQGLHFNNSANSDVPRHIYTLFSEIEHQSVEHNRGRGLKFA